MSDEMEKVRIALGVAKHVCHQLDDDGGKGLNSEQETLALAALAEAVPSLFQAGISRAISIITEEAGHKLTSPEEAEQLVDKLAQSEELDLFVTAIRLLATAAKNHADRYADRSPLDSEPQSGRWN